MMKEYLVAHGVQNVLNLSYEELQNAYSNTIKEELKHYNSLFQEDIGDDSLVFAESDDVNSILKVEITSPLQAHDHIYTLLHTYSPTDLISIMSDMKVSIPYMRLQRMIEVQHIRLQEELLDSINLELESLPEQERETLMFFYENIRKDVLYLAKIKERLKSKAVVDYLEDTAKLKLDILQSHLNKHIEYEYKPFFDNSDIKKEAIRRILAISGIYSKTELFDMQIDNLKELEQAILKQKAEDERVAKLTKKYIDVFDGIASLSEEEFQNICREVIDTLGYAILTEIASYYESRNPHYIANKINAFLNSPSSSKIKN